MTDSEWKKLSASGYLITLTLLHETERAYLCATPGKPDGIWLPKSRVSEESGVFTVPYWLVRLYNLKNLMSSKERRRFNREEQTKLRFSSRSVDKDRRDYEYEVCDGFWGMGGDADYW